MTAKCAGVSSKDHAQDCLPPLAPHSLCYATRNSHATRLADSFRVNMLFQFAHPSALLHHGRVVNGQRFQARTRPEPEIDL